MNSGIEEACYDVAIEAFLLGANYSKFSEYGEEIQAIKNRCKEEDVHLKETLYHFLLYWGSEESNKNESLYYLCEQFVDEWWLEGYMKANKRRKLRYIERWHEDAIFCYDLKEGLAVLKPRIPPYSMNKDGHRGNEVNCE